MVLKVSQISFTENFFLVYISSIHVTRATIQLCTIFVPVHYRNQLPLPDCWAPTFSAGWWEGNHWRHLRAWWVGTSLTSPVIWQKFPVSNDPQQSCDKFNAKTRMIKLIKIHTTTFLNHNNLIMPFTAAKITVMDCNNFLSGLSMTNS